MKVLQDTAKKPLVKLYFDDCIGFFKAPTHRWLSNVLPDCKLKPF